MDKIYSTGGIFGILGTQVPLSAKGPKAVTAYYPPSCRYLQLQVFTRWISAQQVAAIPLVLTTAAEQQGSSGCKQ